MTTRIQSRDGVLFSPIIGMLMVTCPAILFSGCAARSDAATQELERLRSRLVELEESRHRERERLEDLSTRIVALESRPSKRRPDLPVVKVLASTVEHSSDEEAEAEEAFDEEPEDAGPRPVLKLYESRVPLPFAGTQSSGSPKRSGSIALASVNERLPVVPIPDIPGLPPLDTAPASLSMDQDDAGEQLTDAGPSVEEIIATARSQVRGGQCAAALQSLAQVISQSPEHPLAPEAMMLRAQCYSRQGATLRAIGELERLTRRYPNSGRRIDALLEMAEAFVRLGDIERAREIYGEIIRQYPRSRAASRATARIQELGRGQRAREGR